MNCPRLSLVMCAALLLLISGLVRAQPPSAEALAIIEELQLKEAAAPVAKHPGWAPRRVVVLMPPGMGLPPEEFERVLRAAAPDIELVLDKSGSYVPTAEQLAGADGLIGICTKAALQRADSSLLWVHNYSVGMDHCKGYSDEQLQKVIFTNNKRLSGPAIAEHSIAMLLSLSHNLPAYQRAQARGEWQRNLSRGMTFGELKGKTMLIAGLGGIGTEIARRAHGLGMRIIATRNSSRAGPDFVDYVGLSSELLELAGRADVVVNTLPLTADTKGLFNAAFFKAVKPGAMYISVGRGKTTVTADLVAALQSGALFGAGLDVTQPEPLPKGSPLWQMDNVIITPHVAAAGADSKRRTAIISAENLRRYVAGEPLLNVVDMRKGY